MSERTFFIAVLDGEVPQSWVPFKSHGAKLAEIDKTVKARVAEIALPERVKIRIELSLIPDSQIFKEKYSKVYGVIADGRSLLPSSSIKQRSEHQLELVIEKIVSQNTRLESFGLSVLGILDDAAQTDTTALYADTAALYACLERASEPAKRNKVPVHRFVLPFYEALDGHMRNELAKFQSREPFAMVRER
jgi:hypothetical protein